VQFVMVGEESTQLIPVAVFSDIVQFVTEGKET